MSSGLKLRDWLFIIAISNLTTFAIVSLAWSIASHSFAEWIVSPGSAAWTQATFTLLGLAVAVAIAMTQHRQEILTRESSRLREAADSLLYLYVLCEQVYDFIRLLREKAAKREASGAEWRLNSIEATGLFDRLKAAELKAFDGSTRIAILRMNRHLINTLERYVGSDGMVLPVSEQNEVGRAIMSDIIKITRGLQRRSDIAYSRVGQNPWEQDAIYVIKRIGTDGSGKIDRVEWQLYDTDKDEWIGSPAIVSVHAVFRHLIDSVGPIRTSFDGRIADGPRVKLKDGGRDPTLIEIDAGATEMRTLFDLPRI